VLDQNKITERMSSEATDEFPNVLYHGTTWNNLDGIRKAGGLIPGGTRLLKRPIFAETYVLEKGVTGDGHRPESEVSISINPVKLAKACDKDDNRLSISIGNVAQIEGTVAIAKLIRIEVFADGSDFTLWNHPGTNTINWFRCKGEGCGLYLPDGTHLCWNRHCLHPADDQGFQDSLRHFSRSGDNFKIRMLYEKFGRAVPKAQAIREADAAASSSHANDQAPQHVRKVNNSVQKKMKLARRARERKVPELEGTPEERCYYSHKEYYARDAVYAAQCRDNGHVPANSEDGALWFKGTDNDTLWPHAKCWMDADDEHEKMIARKAAGEVYNNPNQPQQSRKLNPASAKRKFNSSGNAWSKDETWSQQSWKRNW